MRKLNKININKLRKLNNMFTSPKYIKYRKKDKLLYENKNIWTLKKLQEQAKKYEIPKNDRKFYTFSLRNLDQLIEIKI